MNAHHLKQSGPPPPGERTGYKMVLHDRIVNRLGLAPFNPLRDFPYVASAKEGRFHQSSCAIALYTNAFTQKAVFPPDLAPFGYINRTFGELFSFGIYRRSDGKLFGSILPLTGDLKAISEFTHLAMTELPIDGIYVRFLRVPDYVRLVSEHGFTPAKEEPWLRDAPEEDESLSHSRVDLRKVFSEDGSKIIFPPLSRNFNRARNFLERAGLDFSFVPLTPDNTEVAWNLVQRHFEMLDGRGKLIGSTHYDYLGLLHPDILSLKTVAAYIGMLGKLPISVFIGEPNSKQAISGYAGITLRGINYLAGGDLSIPMHGDLETLVPTPMKESPHTGASAIPTYVFIRLFSLFYNEGYNHFFMGGSEHADIDTWKHKQMGAEKDPTYWAVYSRK